MEPLELSFSQWQTTRIMLDVLQIAAELICGDFAYGPTLEVKVRPNLDKMGRNEI